MPLYEYECEACGQRFEVIQKFSDAPIEVCTKCGRGPVRKLMSSPAIQFKGSGWYITDYAQKGKSGGDGTGGSSGKSEDKKDDKKSDAAPASDAAKPAATSTTTTPASTTSTSSSKD
jgi:putative FmdB family regulatory protein